MERKTEVIDSTTLPDRVRSLLERRGKSCGYDPDSLYAIANDFHIWAQDVEQASPESECHLLALRRDRYPDLTTPADFHSAEAFLEGLVVKHAHERRERLKQERERQLRNPSRLFSVAEARVIGAQAALASGLVAPEKMLETRALARQGLTLFMATSDRKKGSQNN